MTVSLVEVISYHDVLNGSVAEDVLKGKIVLLGETVRGLTPSVRMPDEYSVTPVILAANTLASLLDGKDRGDSRLGIFSHIRPPYPNCESYFFGYLAQNLRTRIMLTAAMIMILIAIEVMFMLWLWSGLICIRQSCCCLQDFLLLQ